MHTFCRTGCQTKISSASCTFSVIWHTVEEAFLYCSIFRSDGVRELYILYTHKRCTVEIQNLFYKIQDLWFHHNNSAFYSSIIWLDKTRRICLGQCHEIFYPCCFTMITLLTLIYMLKYWAYLQNNFQASLKTDFSLIQRVNTVLHNFCHDLY